MTQETRAEINQVLGSADHMLKTKKQFGHKLQLPAPTKRPIQNLTDEWDHLPVGDEALMLNLKESKAIQNSLSPEQVQFAGYLAMPRSIRPKMIEIAARLGLHPTTLSRWKHNTNIKIVAARMASSYIMKEVPEVLHALVKGAKAGNVAAAQLMLKLWKLIDPDIGVQNNTINNVKLDNDDIQEMLGQLRKLKNDPQDNSEE